jgi:dolichyl-diphosphooligosaccharide--protein glycosyltransferase
MDRGKRSEPAELFAVVILGILLRLFAGRNSFSENGIILPGYDEFYHMRRILFSAQNFPDTLWFDSYLNYPHGLEITWPPLFDQISAALCVILGQHSQTGVETVASVIPIITGIMAIVAVYYIVRELFDHKTALLAAFMTALAPYYLLYTMFAAMDHHCLEVLLSLAALLFMILAMRRSEKRFLFASAAGVVMAALAYTWQGTDIYLAIFPLYAAVQMTLDIREGKTNGETTKLLLIAFAIAFVLLIPFGNTNWLRVSFLGIGAMIIAMGAMFALAQIITKRAMTWKAFPLSILILGVLFVLISELSGGLFGVGTIIENGFEYIWGGEMIGRIGEAEPLIYNSETFSEVMFSFLGINLLLSLAGLAAVIKFIHRSTGSIKQGQIMLLIWTTVTIALTFGQARFLYVSTISMGLLISILFVYLYEAMLNRQKVDATDAASSGFSRHSRLLAAVLLLLLVLPTAWDAVYFAQSSVPAVSGDWEESLAWLKENSNATSFFDSPQKTPEYSVMNWWDYGNWVLYLTKRPVVSNNFQAGLTDAAKFYLSESEDKASAILDAKKSRYILTDYSLIYAKLAAITNWAEEDIGSYMGYEDYGTQYTIIPKERLFNTTLARIYLFDGAGMGHFRLIHESKTFMGENPAKSKVKIFEYVPGALIRVRADPDKKVGALLNMTSNQGRPFVYVNEAQARNGAFEIRVPYATEKRDGCHATTPYLVFSGNKDDLKTENLEVSEQDVIQGRTIELNL